MCLMVSMMPLRQWGLCPSRCAKGWVVSEGLLAALDELRVGGDGVLVDVGDVELGT